MATGSAVRRTAAEMVALSSAAEYFLDGAPAASPLKTKPRAGDDTLWPADLARFVTRYSTEPYVCNERQRLSDELGRLKNNMTEMQEHVRTLRVENVRMAAALMDVILTALQQTKTSQADLGLVLRTHNERRPKSLPLEERLEAVYIKTEIERKSFWEYLKQVNKVCELNMPHKTFDINAS